MFISNPPIPYCGSIQTKLIPGTLIRITGTVSHSPTCFAINLQLGPSVNPRDDVALHLSPVFNPPPRIVRNSISGQRWGAEESFGGFPIYAGQAFEFMILVEHAEYRIALNGSHFTEFRHRLPYERVSFLAIDGDCQISAISVEGGGSGSDYGYQSTPAAVPPPYGASGGVPYPVGGLAATMPYPVGGDYAGAGGGMYPSIPPPAYGQPAYGSTYPSTVPPSQPSPYGASTYPSAQQGYPGQQAYPPGGGGAYGGYSQPPPPPGSQQQSSGSGFGKILTGLTAGAAGTGIGAMVGSALSGGKHKSSHGYPGVVPGMASGGILGTAAQAIGLGGSHKPHKANKSSSGIPLAGLAAGAGAAALGAAVLTGHHPFKKAKKMFKHKHKFGKFKHKGWGSSSSSSEEE